MEKLIYCNILSLTLRNLTGIMGHVSPEITSDWLIEPNWSD